MIEGIVVPAKKKKFKGALQSGHQEDAVEVPFDPALVWGIPSAPLWRGRKGHTVKATVNGVAFAGFIVARQRRFFLLVDTDIEQEARVSVGDTVAVTVTAVSGQK